MNSAQNSPHLTWKLNVFSLPINVSGLSTVFQSFLTNTLLTSSNSFIFLSEQELGKTNFMNHKYHSKQKNLIINFAKITHLYYRCIDLGGIKKYYVRDVYKIQINNKSSRKFPKNRCTSLC